MTEWKARRFWKKADIRPAGDGWEVVLDDKPVRTPGKKPLILPTEALAHAIAEEWDAQGDIIDPNAMPLTRAANSAIEKVAPQFDEVAAMLANMAPPTCCPIVPRGRMIWSASRRRGGIR